MNGIEKDDVTTYEKYIGYPDYGDIGLALFDKNSNEPICSIMGLTGYDINNTEVFVNFDKVPYSYSYYISNPKLTIEKIVSDILATL